MTNTQPLTWPPYKITAIEIGDERTGFIGRAAALRIHGIETVIMCRNVEELTTICGELTEDNFDADRIYKATMIRTEGVEVEIPETPAEVDVPPVKTEVPATPVKERPKREDGVPVVQYLGETDEEADERIQRESEAFEQAHSGGTDESKVNHEDDEL